MISSVVFLVLMEKNRNKNLEIIMYTVLPEYPVAAGHVYFNAPKIFIIFNWKSDCTLNLKINYKLATTMESTPSVSKF